MTISSLLPFFNSFHIEKAFIPLFLFFVFLFFTFLEWRFPLRMMTEKKRYRLLKNGGYFFLNSFLGRGLFISLFLFAIEYRWYDWRDLHQQYLHFLPPLLMWLILYLCYDLFIYSWHRLNHRIDFLFAFHQLHHADRNMDVSTGLRFHPGEYFFSYAFKSIFLLALGLEIKDLFLFDSILLFFSFFQHANLKMPLSLEHFLGQIFITPRMHDIHHSIESVEMNSYFGTSFVFWDKLFRTQKPIKSQPTNQLGLSKFPETPSFLSGLFSLK